MYTKEICGGWDRWDDVDSVPAKDPDPIAIATSLASAVLDEYRRWRRESGALRGAARTVFLALTEGQWRISEVATEMATPMPWAGSLNDLRDRIVPWVRDTMKSK